MWLDPNPPRFPSDAAVAWGEDAFGLWQAVELNGVRQVLRWIRPGRFLMGSPGDEEGRYNDEVQHEVTLSRGYWLADTACTQALWLAVTDRNQAYFKDDPQNPVEQVSWDDCQGFLTKANARLPPDLQLRLPSEAEWEHACRAGTQTAFSWGDSIGPGQANYSGKWDDLDFSGKTVGVLSHQPNPWGLYQMHGNVWEWCADWSGDYRAQPVVDPAGPAGGRRRVLRGGGWMGGGRLLRSAYRGASTPDDRDHLIGLRLAGG